MEFLVDTSVWCNHLRSRNKLLSKYLELGLVYTHDFIIGEIALGNLSVKSSIVMDLQQLKSLPQLEAKEVLSFIRINKLAGTGLSWIDANLLASALVARLELMTYDKKLSKIWTKISFKHRIN